MVSLIGLTSHIQHHKPCQCNWTKYSLVLCSNRIYWLHKTEHNDRIARNHNFQISTIWVKNSSQQTSTNWSFAGRNCLGPAQFPSHHKRSVLRVTSNCCDGVLFSWSSLSLHPDLPWVCTLQCKLQSLWCDPTWWFVWLVVQLNSLFCCDFFVR